MAKRKTPKKDRKAGWSIDQLPSGRFRLRVWDANLRKYKTSSHDTREKAEAEADTTKAKFKLALDSAATATLEVVWDSYATEAYGITGEEADRITQAERVREAADALGNKLRANWRTIYAMGRVVEMMRQAGAVDFKASGFRKRIVTMFNTLDLPRTRAGDGRVAVSTKLRMKGQVRALVNHAVQAGWLTSSPLAGMKVTGDRQQSDTTREVFSLSEVRALVALHRIADPVWVHAMLMLYAGLRDSEAQAMTWMDYDADRRLLWVRRAKGGKARTIPVQPELAEILAEVSDAMGPTADHPCIPSTPIARPMAGRSLARYENFTRMLKDAGITRVRGIDPITNMKRALCRHSCRHTFAAVMLACGEDGDSLRTAMGHKEEQLTVLYASQTATFRAEVEAENWRRGRLQFRTSNAKSEAAT
jgi:integrase